MESTGEHMSKGLPRSSTAPQHSHSHSHHIQRHKTRHRHGPLARSTISNAVPAQLKTPFDLDNYNPLKRNHLTSSADSNRWNSKESVNPKAQNSIPPPPTVTQADVDAERSLRSAREDDIQSTLRSLDNAAHEATRRLDDTYYALLERLGTLRSTVSALQKLYNNIEHGRKEFESQTKELGNKTNGQLDEFGGFREQEQDIEELVTRLENGRMKAKEVEKRLEGVRGRLERWEEKERENKKVRKRRWGMFWTFIGLVIGLLLAIAIWKGFQGKNHEVINFVSDVTKQVEVGLGMERKTRRKNESLGIRVKGSQGHKEEDWKHVLDEL